MTIRQALSRFPAPDQREAEDRAWEVVRSAFAERQPASRPRAHRTRAAGVAAAVVLAGSMALSPAGATVGRLISRAFGVQHASPALVSLPAPGRLLVSGPGGTWTVGVNGSKRWVGPWRNASWSPHGRYLAVARRDQLDALTSSGLPQWALTRPEVTDPRWYQPSGYRVAYLSGRDLRVVAGDGAADHLVAAGVERVAPAWRPGHPYQLAYLTAGGRLWVRDADTGAALWSAMPSGRVRQLDWSADGRLLLAVSSRTVFVYSASGRALLAEAAPGDAPIRSAALSPDGRSLSLVSSGVDGGAVLVSLAAHPAKVRRVLTGMGLGQAAFSPNGRWLLITWPAADQWVFVRVLGPPRIAAMSRITQQFPSGRSSRFPRLDGWCCSAAGAGG